MMRQPVGGGQRVFLIAVGGAGWGGGRVGTWASCQHLLIASLNVCLISFELASTECPARVCVCACVKE